MTSMPFFLDEARDGIGHFLGEGPVGPSRIGSVEVPRLRTRELLARCRVDVDVGVGPLVDGVSWRGKPKRKVPLSRGRGDREVAGGAFSGIGMARGRGVDPRYDEEPTRLRARILDEEDGGHVARGLVGVRPSEDEGASARLSRVEDIDIGIAGAALESSEVIGEPRHAGHAGAPSGSLQAFAWRGSRAR